MKEYTIAELEKEGWEGIDMDLAVSLFEYGLIWKETKEQGVFKFCYLHTNNEGEFDYRYESGDVDVYEAFDWVSWGIVYSFTGLQERDFKAMPFPLQIFHLVSYYGAYEILGESYNEGFKIIDDR